MHKYYLTKPECEIIEESDKIISVFGGFPSMENGKLIGFTVESDKTKPHLLDVILSFDIAGWKDSIEFHRQYSKSIAVGRTDPEDLDTNRITLRFEGARDVYTHSDGPFMDGIIDIYFSNSFERKQMIRAGIPEDPMIIPRPYCSFYLAIRQIIIEFFEEECRISAEFTRQ